MEQPNFALLFETVFALCQSLLTADIQPMNCPHKCARADLPMCLQAAGIPETLVRLSVGVEDTADLIQDIQQALTAAGTKVLHVSNGGGLR